MYNMICARCDARLWLANGSDTWIDIGACPDCDKARKMTMKQALQLTGGGNSQYVNKMNDLKRRQRNARLGPNRRSRDNGLDTGQKSGQA